MSPDRVSKAEEFEELRPLLFSIAYRILGSVSEAEDAVQETWLRYDGSSTVPNSTRAFLSAVVTRISIDVLRSARVRREEYVGRPRFEADRREQDELAARFFDALREGDVGALRELLAADVQLVGDGGGKAPQWARIIIGAEHVTRTLPSVFPGFLRIGVVLEQHEVNGQPGAILRDRDGKVLNAWSLEVHEGHVQTIRSVINPDKLGHVGPVADAWALVREALEARRVG